MVYMHKETYDLYPSPCFNGVDDADLFIEIEDAVSFAVSVLNKKGYKTAMSCSGHPFNDTGIWISFELEYNIFGNLPDGFYLYRKHPHDDVVFLRYKIKSNINSVCVLQELATANIGLYKWALEL